jgi:inorganic pyrophosphatase
MRSLIELPALAGPGLFHVVVESPRGATSKIKYDEGLCAFTLSRYLPLGMSYPHDWGFVPGTRGEDGDPVDAFLLSEGTTFSGMVIAARPIALLGLEQNRKGTPGRERNDRILAVAAKAPRNDVQGPEDLPTRVRQEIERFFLDSVFFEHKDPRILGWEGPEAALALVRRSVQEPGRERAQEGQR